MSRSEPTTQPPGGKRLLVAGAGGNIGSHLVSHLARMPFVSRVTLVDPGIYEPKNLWSQDIAARDAGRPKAEVRAEALRRVRDDLEVEAVREPLERLPLGGLRADVVLSCLDSRRSRQSLNRAVRRLGVPWIDAGVEADQLLARVTTFPPGDDPACLECGWDARDYDALEPVYSCSGAAVEAPETRASSGLGALAAALQAVECQELLGGTREPLAPAREVVFATAHHRVYVTALPRNPACRLHGHGAWRVETLAEPPSRITLREAFALGESGAPLADRTIRVADARFVTALVCASCGRRRSLLRLEASIGPRDRRCRACGGEAVAPGFDRLDRLEARDLPAHALERPLARLGLRPGEIFTVGTPEGERHYELPRESE